MEYKIFEICENTDETVFRQVCEKRFGKINNKDPVDYRNNIKTDDKTCWKRYIFFPVKKITDQNIIYKIGPDDLENPVT